MTPWPGCRVATANASYWHCRLRLRDPHPVRLTPGMGEHRVGTAMEMCRRCAAVYAGRAA